MLQAAYFVRHGFRRRDKRSNMLLVTSNMCPFDYMFYASYQYKINFSVGKILESHGY